MQHTLAHPDDKPETQAKVKRRLNIVTKGVLACLLEKLDQVTVPHTTRTGIVHVLYAHDYSDGGVCPSVEVFSKSLQSLAKRVL